jgi:hypothetical protein
VWVETSAIEAGSESMQLIEVVACCEDGEK